MLLADFADLFAKLSEKVKDDKETLEKLKEARRHIEFGKSVCVEFRSVTASIRKMELGISDVLKEIGKTQSLNEELLKQLKQSNDNQKILLERLEAIEGKVAETATPKKRWWIF